MEKAVVQKKPILNYINIFRALAIILILMGHTLQFGAENSYSRIISKEIFTGGTALFVFIAGYLFQYLSYKFEYKNYLKKKWQNVILPYIITSIPGISLCLCIPLVYKNPFFGLNPLIQIPMFLTTGRVHNVPAWFIPMIVIFFVLSSLLIYLEKKNILYKILPFLLLVTVFLARGDIEPEWVMDYDYAGRYLAYLNYVLTGFVHFLSCYVLGMYFSSRQDAVDKFVPYRNWLLLLFVLFTAFDIYLQINYRVSNVTVPKLILTVLSLVWLKKCDGWFLSRPKLNSFLDVIAKYSFGLFFVHWYFVFLFNQFFPSGINSFPLAILRFIVVFALSFLTLYILKTLLSKIGVKNTRMFTGV